MKSTDRRHSTLFSVLLCLACLAATFMFAPNSQPTLARTEAEKSQPARPDTPVGSGFTFQGQLKDGGSPANGPYDFIFTLYDAATAGNQVGNPITMLNQNIANGIVAQTLDFGAGTFQGQARWLEIQVRQAGGGSYTTLSPRQAITAVPNALSLVTGAVITSTLTGPALAITNTNGVGLRVVSSNRDGVRGESNNANGVFGTSNTYIGVAGDSISNAGVYGSSDNWYGVYGISDSSNGVYGQALVAGVAGVYGSGHGSGYGVYGSGGYGVWGEASVTSGVGVRGDSTSGYGVWGDSSSNYGVLGTSYSSTGVRGGSTNGVGVYGFSLGNTGVYGVSDSSWYFDAGVKGEATSTGGKAVYGVANYGSLAYGVYGTSTSGTGVYGESTSNNAIRAQTSGGGSVAGVWGVSLGAGGNGVVGQADNGAGAWGVWGRSASGYAGYFSGNAQVTGNLSKGGGSFKIDHPLDPENKYLYHSFVESPDMMNIYNGNVALDAKGEAWVQMPGWFDALNRDFRYQLTAIGAPGPNLYVAEKIKGNRFKIAGGTAGSEVSWMVTGIREDAYANAHRIPVEEDKPADEQGTYLHPTEYGQPESKGKDYERLQQTQQTPQTQKQAPKPPVTKP